MVTVKKESRCSLKIILCHKSHQIEIPKKEIQQN